MGHQSYFQADRLLASLGGLGVIPHRWESRQWQLRRSALLEAYPEFGGFAGEHFKPRKWRPIADVPPFVRMTERDRYWGAKRIAAFADDELRGAIAAGHYRLEAAEWLFQSLVQRRDAIARDGFARVAPLDYFHVDGNRLCFTDWWVRAGLGGGDATEYRAREAGALVDVHTGSAPDGGACVGIGTRPGYRVILLAALRPGERHFGPDVAVHLVAGDGTPPHVVGVVR